MKKLKGVVPPMITPFDEEGRLDEYNLQKLVEYLSPKVDGLFICGSYGCGPLMTLQERKRVAEVVKKYSAPDTKIVVHTGALTTEDTTELTLHAAETGCDAAAAVGPYYFHYGDEELIRYYSDVIEAAGEKIPFYAYHNPKFQGYETSLNVMKQLKDAGLAGIKDATFDLMNYAVYERELVDDNFDLALGTEALWISAHALGCRAYIPGIGNVFPELCKEMFDASMDGEQAKARELQFMINKLRDIMYLAGSTQLAINAIAEISGIMAAHPRRPFLPPSAGEKEAIKDALKGLGVI